MIRAAVLTSAVRSLPGSIRDAERAAGLLRAVMQARQAPAADATGEASTVVDNLDAHVVLNRDRHRKSGRAGVPHNVADRFAHNGFGVIGKCSIDNRQRSHELDRGTPLGSAELRDCVVESLSQPGDVRRYAMQVENCGADLADNALKIVDAAGQSLLQLN